MTKRDTPAASVVLFKCGECKGIHLRCDVARSPVRVVAILDPDKWAEMFMQDEDFRREVAAILAKPLN